MDLPRPTLHEPNIRRIAIVGGGPTGVACAKYFLAENAFNKIDVFEQRSNVGGIWNLSNPTYSREINIPQTDPKYGVAEHDKQLTNALEFESPLYDYLETNIPKPLMAYSDTPFDDNLPLFPGHADVLRYLENYAAPVQHLIHFRTQVIGLQPSENGQHLPDSLSQEWTLTLKYLDTDKIRHEQYDAIVVANGHYTIPHVPSIQGLAAWNLRYPGTVIHSKAYRRPEDYQDKKVLVIGNSASGLDIAAQLASDAQTPVYLASRSASQLAPKGNGPTWRKDVTEIEEFLGPDYDRGVRTKTGDIIEGLETVIFATGYFYSFPFLNSNKGSQSSSPEAASPSESTDSLDTIDTSQDTPSDSPDAVADTSQRQKVLNRLVTSGLRLHDIHKHFLHIEFPTLAFPVLNLKIIPFPLAENQAAVLARLWSGRLELPSKSEMRTWEDEEQKRLLLAHRLRPAPDTATGDTVTTEKNSRRGFNADPDTLIYEAGFHTLVYPEDAAQINTLHQWAKSACPNPNLENNGVGKLGTSWDERQVWMRGQFPDIKAAYAKRGNKRSEVTSLDMLGEEWKHGFENWKSKTSQEEQEKLFRKAEVSGW